MEYQNTRYLYYILYLFHFYTYFTLYKSTTCANVLSICYVLYYEIHLLLDLLKR